MAAIVALMSGCGDACAEAESLCEDCEIEGADCAAAFADASQEFCEQAIDAYEASCPEG